MTVLHHLGLADEVVWEVAWDELDRSFVPDHLTVVWIPEPGRPGRRRSWCGSTSWCTPCGPRCPWDREQTHGSLARHLLEESYEVLEAIDALVGRCRRSSRRRCGAAEPSVADEAAVAHLEEELGDLLFQVYFHAALAAEEGRFTLADVARGVHDKLVARHPHVFGDATADTRRGGGRQTGRPEEGGEGPVECHRGHPGGPAGPGPGGQAAAEGAGRRHGASRSGRRGGTGGRGRGGLQPTVIEPAAARRRGRPTPTTTAEIGELLFALVNLARTPRGRSGDGAAGPGHAVPGADRSDRG